MPSDSSTPLHGIQAFVQVSDTGTGADHSGLHVEVSIRSENQDQRAQDMLEVVSAHVRPTVGSTLALYTIGQGQGNGTAGSQSSGLPGLSRIGSFMLGSKGLYVPDVCCLRNQNLGSVGSETQSDEGAGENTAEQEIAGKDAVTDGYRAEQRPLLIDRSSYGTITNDLTGLHQDNGAEEASVQPASGQGDSTDEHHGNAALTPGDHAPEVQDSPSVENRVDTGKNPSGDTLSRCSLIETAIASALLAAHPSTYRPPSSSDVAAPLPDVKRSFGNLGLQVFTDSAVRRAEAGDAPTESIATRPETWKDRFQTSLSLRYDGTEGSDDRAPEVKAALANWACARGGAKQSAKAELICSIATAQGYDAEEIPTDVRDEISSAVTSMRSAWEAATAVFGGQDVGTRDRFALFRGQRADTFDWAAWGEGLPLGKNIFFFMG